MRFLLSSVALAIAWTAGAQGTSEAIVSHFNPSPVVTTVSSTAGWTFQPVTTITVTELGCFDDLFINTPTATAIWVGLWAANGSLLASNSITPSSALFNQTRYESITPVALAAGQVYNVGVYSPDGAVSMEVCGPSLGGTVSAGPEVTLRAAALNTNTVVLAFPPEVPGTSGLAYLGPNFQYQGRVPEPSSWALLGAGALLLAARRRARPR